VITEETLTVETDQNSTTILINVVANATDADGDPLTISELGTPSAGGTVAIQDNQVAYTPATGFSGQETFTYTLTDGEGGTVSGTVSVSVIAPPPPPLGIASASSNDSGGGSFGPFLLLLLALRRKAAHWRKTKVSTES